MFKRINLPTIVSLLFSLLLLSGCFGENIKKTDQSKEVNTAKTEAALKGTDKLVQPPINTNTNAPTYTITVARGATINSPLLPAQPVPPPAEMKATPPATQDSTIERGIKDNSSNKLEEKSSSEKKSGWYAILIALAFCLVVGGLIALKIFYGRAMSAAEDMAVKTKEVVVGGVENAVNFVKEEMAWAKPDTPEHGMAEKIQIKLEGLARTLAEALKKK